MTPTSGDNSASGVFLLLVLLIQLLGLLILLRGLPVVGWLLTQAGRLFALLAGVLLRGVVVLFVLIVIYVLISQNISPSHVKTEPTSIKTGYSGSRP